jgi:hypothetical protein
MGTLLESFTRIVERRSGSDLLLGATGSAVFLGVLARVVGSDLMLALSLITAAACFALLMVVWFVAVPEWVSTFVHKNAVLQSRMVELMDEGKASPEGMIENAKANEANWRQLDRLLSGGVTDVGTKSAERGT